MGLIVDICRTPGDCTNGGVSSRVDSLTLVNVEGPFEPTPERPAARLVRRHIGRIIWHVEPVERPEGAIGPMMGGNYVATSDSRLSKQVGFYGALALHDRFETPQQYEALSR